MVIIEEEKIEALSLFLWDNYDRYDVEKMLENWEYRVLTEDEVEEEMQNYIDDLLSSIDDNLLFYFDRNRFADDIICDRDAWDTLSCDGQENTQVYDGITYYIYFCW